ncbi:double-strand break repair protein MRE11-like [Portunus trituberculatus]|uniref:double-strand break repair protein MRE11-like n=1 Tax=Portunus trituberculatus TaxID=210409 RepID=UPI001E1CBC72|nr:double-strand break repair protein MRE11-like [Portunus trituberculatus]XP_045115363.1 double-strand break repair protein MRE11-like [Portunus trituberculatus]XP_045115364.1 double-strand break repair protein MRE11-like [Portunus trituberculatus]XP_045115365.1 double-strand break repair protein MRE11-like [Portunus trituberculatus]
MATEDDDSFRILVATDTHLGYAEKHPERGNDSFQSFEEVLELAVEHNVDFILLGGDLFHENKPSRYCQVRCMDLLRKYTFGDRPVHFNILSDPAVNFPHTKQVNFLDPNLNVAIPVFSIHGNHDDPAGMGLLCALEMLSSAGLINYFGRVSDLNDIKISPVLMEKGNTKLALYGLSSIKDERLHRLFVENKVKMLRPKESLTEWFNLMTVHQNHAKRGPSNYLPESFLDPFLDLVIWGHEHDCIKEPRHSHQNFHVLQPGSSVATSLTPGEAEEKCAFLLQVNSHHQFKVDPLPLKTVRPFLFEEVFLSEYNIEDEVKRIKKTELTKEESTWELLMKAKALGEAKGKGRGRGRGSKASDAASQAQIKDNPVELFVEHRVRELLKGAKKLLTGHPRQPTLPLIRVRVHYSDEAEIFNVSRFGFKFDGLVANTEDLVSFVREKVKNTDSGQESSMGFCENLINVDDVTNTVEGMVEEMFRNSDTTGCEMRLLTERGMSAAISAYVQKEDRHAVPAMIDYQVQRMQEYLLSLDKDYDDPQELEADILAFRAERNAAANLEKEEDEFQVLEALKVNKAKNGSTKDQDEDEDEDIRISDDDDSDVEFSLPSSGRGARGRGGRGSRGGSRGTTSTAHKPRGSRGRARKCLI